MRHRRFPSDVPSATANVSSLTRIHTGAIATSPPRAVSARVLARCTVGFTGTVGVRNAAHRMRRSRCHDGAHDGQHDRGSKADFLQPVDEVPTGILLNLGFPFQEVDTPKATQGIAHDLSVGRFVELVSEDARQLRDRRLPIAVTPHDRRGTVESMGSMLPQVINQNFVEEVLHRQILFPTTRFIVSLAHVSSLLD